MQLASVPKLLTCSAHKREHTSMVKSHVGLLLLSMKV